ncbi:hypothetical protein GCM10017161_07020 [Thalassotalea marina]|uniref:Uncharacterized protein n=2 Tax=Thalassotalea marina TaxID=1673741 RepID=A0A919EIE4_9GAMM|nr:hypothetical protein GCM10017161_07020 [Thalassotalea marina]
MYKMICRLFLQSEGLSYVQNSVEGKWQTGSNMTEDELNDVQERLWPQGVNIYD